MLIYKHDRDCNPEPKSIDISTESSPISLGRSFLLMCTPHFPLAIPASISLTFPTQAKQFLPLWKCTSYLTLMHHFCPGAWTLCFLVTQTTLGRTYARCMVPELEPDSTRRFYIFLFSIGKKKQTQVHMEKGENIPGLSNFISHPGTKPHCQVESCLLHGNLTSLWSFLSFRSTVPPHPFKAYNASISCFLMKSQ